MSVTDMTRTTLFREIMKLDESRLERLRSFVDELSKEENDEELLDGLLDECARHALCAEKAGEVYTTEEAFEQVNQMLGWK